MPRRRTTVGVGAFGRPISKDLHEWEILHRIIDNKQPLTEDAVFLLLHQVLKRNPGTILKCVRSSKVVGDYGYFYFTPDIDLLEVRKNGTIVGYELKGYKKSGRGYTSPSYYAGLDEALAYLINPAGIPSSESSSTGSIFDYVYLVHPFQEAFPSGLEPFAELLNRCTPIGLIAVTYSGTREIVKAKRNPFLNEDVKKQFLNHFDAFRSAFEYRLNLAQK